MKLTLLEHVLVMGPIQSPSVMSSTNPLLESQSHLVNLLPSSFWPPCHVPDELDKVESRADRYYFVWASRVRLRTLIDLHNQIRQDFPTTVSTKQRNSFDQHHPNNQIQKRFHFDNHYSIANLRNQSHMKMDLLDFVVEVSANPSRK